MPARDRWVRLISELDATNEPAHAFAARHDLNLNTLKWWRSRLHQERALAPRPAFVELRPTAPARPILLRLDRVAAAIEVSTDTDLRLLRRLLDALC